MSRISCYTIAIISYLFGVLSATDQEVPLLVWPLFALWFIYTFINVFDDSSSAPVTGGSVESEPTDKPTT